MNKETDASPEIRFLKQHIQHASIQLEQQDSRQTSEGMGSLIYLGNHQDAIPRNLILDPHLESGEIHTWTLLKIQLINPALPSSIPTQNDLMEILKCSRPVLSRHLQVLRALRWITLCAEVRGKDGQYRGNVYAQHDTPLSLQDTLYLDPSYIQFLEQPSSGSTLKRLRQVKEAVLRHMDYQVVNDIQLDQLPSYLSQVGTKMEKLDTSDPLDTHLACPEGATKPNQVTNLYAKEGSSDKTGFILKDVSEHGHVNNFYMDHVKVYMDDCSSSYIKTTTTKHERLIFPKALSSERLRLYAAKIIDVLKDEQQQQFALDYLTDRIRAGEMGTDKPVGNPIGFLNWIVRQIQDDTLPESVYGVRDKQNTLTRPSFVDDKIKRHQEHEDWIRSMRERGFEINPKTGRTVKRVDAVSR